jgi:hypothetical protein
VLHVRPPVLLCIYAPKICRWHAASDLVHRRYRGHMTNLPITRPGMSCKLHLCKFFPTYIPGRSETGVQVDYSPPPRRPSQGGISEARWGWMFGKQWGLLATSAQSQQISTRRHEPSARTTMQPPDTKACMCDPPLRNVPGVFRNARAWIMNGQCPSYAVI